MHGDAVQGDLSVVGEVSAGTSGGQVTVGATLISSADIGSESEALIILDWPDGLETGASSAGLVGTATATAFPSNAGPMGILAKVLLWVRMLGTYL